MRLLRVYAALYASSLVRALRGIRRSPWTLLLPIAIWGAALVAGGVAGQLGFLGGILYALALDVLISSYLYFTSEVVADSRVSVRELRRSLGAFFFAVLNVFFVIWVVELMLGFALANNEHALVIGLMVRFAAFVLLNVTPEVIYQRGTYAGIATIQESVRFIHASWIEWFVPNLAFGALFYFGVPFLLGLGVPLVVVVVLAGALLHVVMVFRGHLFRELDGSSHRQRMMRARGA